jgi:hypothetical protein
LEDAYDSKTASVVHSYQRRRQILIAGLRASLHCNPTEAGSQPKLFMFELSLPIFWREGDTYAETTNTQARTDATPAPRHHSQRITQDAAYLRNPINIEPNQRGQREASLLLPDR